MAGLLKSLPFRIFSAIICANASPHPEVRQTAPGLSAGWAPIGCYSDSITSRTLLTAVFADANAMTIESCLTYCTRNGYQFAGIEFGYKCYCDNIIEATGALADNGCTMPCAGNAAEISGGTDRVNIFHNTAIVTTPPPIASIKQSVGNFSYRGCFQDAVDGAPRSLLHQLNFAGGVSAESCTVACKASGFPLAGLEFGQQCWCDDYMALVIPAPDSDCSTPCQADDTELCGSGNRLVYQDITKGIPNVSTCLTNQRFTNVNQPFKFDLQAVPNPNGGTPIQIGALEFTAHAGAPSYFILSVNPRHFTGITHLLTLGAFMRPDSFQNEGSPISLAPNVGSAQVFALFSTFAAYAGYCAKPNPVGFFGPFIGPPVLSVSGRSDQWALCSNTTAGGRKDVVFSPTTTSGDYALSGCQSVVLQMSQPI